MSKPALNLMGRAGLQHFLQLAFLNSRPSSCLRPQLPSCFSRRDCWQFQWQVTEVRAQDLPVQCLPLVSGTLVVFSCIPSVDIPSTQLGQGCYLL